MEAKVLSSGIQHSTLPQSYIRPESERPLLSQVSACDDVPVEEKMKLYSEDPLKTVRLSTSFNVNKEKVHNWRDYLRLHCDPLDTCLPQWPCNSPSVKYVSLLPSSFLSSFQIGLSTSFNVNKEKVHNWRDYLRLHCYPLDTCLPQWPCNSPSVKDTVSNYCVKVRELGFRIQEYISESLGLPKDYIKNKEYISESLGPQIIIDVNEQGANFKAELEGFDRVALKRAANESREFRNAKQRKESYFDSPNKAKQRAIIEEIRRRQNAWFVNTGFDFKGSLQFAEGSLDSADEAQRRRKGKAKKVLFKGESSSDAGTGKKEKH